MRRIIISALAALALVLAVGGAVVAGSGGGSSITRARLERSLPTTFANLYAQQAKMLGHEGITPASLQAKAMCDKGGAAEADEGPGSNWTCLMSWQDPNVPMPPEGYGRLELSVHSNGCYTAGLSSKFGGYATLTDTRGNTVTNPVAEFDGCFDPQGDNTPTGVEFPSVVQTTTTALLPDGQNRVGIELLCSTGEKGCAGTVTAMAGTTTLGTVPFDMPEETSANLQFPTPVPAGAGTVTFTFATATGVGPSSPVELDMPKA